jgi:hypothetical protein
MTSSTKTTAPGPELDEKVLLRLFDLAGPAQTREILDRLIQDLGGVQNVLAQSATIDIATLRRQNHTLIGIAGTVGAGPLHQMALETGRLLRDSATPEAEAVVAPQRPLVDRLIARLVQMRAER